MKIKLFAIQFLDGRHIMKKSLSIVSIILLVGLGTTFVYAQYDVPANYSTIQAAINAAPASMSYYILPQHIYRECNRE